MNTARNLSRLRKAAGCGCTTRCLSGMPDEKSASARRQEAPGRRTRLVSFPLPLKKLPGIFPQFEILGFIGQGGMGRFYKARQKQLDRIVALKILPPQVASGPGFRRPFYARSPGARQAESSEHCHALRIRADGWTLLLPHGISGRPQSSAIAACRTASRRTKRWPSCHKSAMRFNLPTSGASSIATSNRVTFY